MTMTRREHYLRASEFLEQAEELADNRGMYSPEVEDKLNDLCVRLAAVAQVHATLASATSAVEPSETTALAYTGPSVAEAQEFFAAHPGFGSVDVEKLRKFIENGSRPPEEGL